MTSKVENILILGSNGSIGSSLAAHLIHENIIYSDKNRNLSEILNVSYILQSNINTIVNCIGSYAKEEDLFHSNFYLPLYIANMASDLSDKYQYPINFINISSLGITAPYSTLSLQTLQFSPFIRSQICLNKYEFSKLCFDTTYIYLFQIQILNVSLFSYQIFFESLILPLFKLFSILCPFRIDKKRTLPLSSINDILSSVQDLIKNISRYQSSYNVIKAYSHYPASSLLPSFSSSPVKFIIPPIFSSFLPHLVNLPFIGRFARLMIFFYIL